MNGMLYSFTYHESMSDTDQNELRDQKLYNALARYNYWQFFKEGRLAVLVSATKIGYGTIREDLLLHVTVTPCVPVKDNHADYSYLFPMTEDQYIDLQAERHGY